MELYLQTPNLKNTMNTKSILMVAIAAMLATSCVAVKRPIPPITMTPLSKSEGPINGSNQAQVESQSSSANSSGSISIVSGRASYSDEPGFVNVFAVPAPQSVDAMLSSRLQSKAMLFTQGGRLMVKMSKGDFVDITRTSSQDSVIGIGSEMRFDPENWVDFLGAKYRKGGFKVKPEGIQFDDVTEKNENGKILKCQGGQWTPTEAN
jgi:hypothetical protein